MNLYEVIMGAQGGQGVNDARQSVRAFAAADPGRDPGDDPRLLVGLQRRRRNRPDFGGLLDQMMSGAHAGRLCDPAQTAAASNLAAMCSARSSARPRSPRRLDSRPRSVRRQRPDRPADDAGRRLDAGRRHRQCDGRAGPGRRAQPDRQRVHERGGARPAVNPAAAAQAQAGKFQQLDEHGRRHVHRRRGAGAPPRRRPRLQATVNSLNTMLQAGVQISQAHQQGLPRSWNRSASGQG